ncbi:MAG: replicative DNA helicase [Candidatus Brocadiia bacterium]
MPDLSDASSSARVPPHDLQAEMGVLGSMLLSQEAIHLARRRLRPESFYKLAHQDIFRAVLELSDANNAVDIVLLRDELSRREKLEKVGGVGYLLELMEAVPTSANAEHYIGIVWEHGVRRQLIETAAGIQKNAYRNSQDVNELLDEAEAHILAVRSEKDSARVREVNDVLQNIVARLEELHQNPGQLTGLASGFYDLDDMTGGFHAGEFVVVAARPSIGKTSFALNVLHHVCTVQRRPAALYSLEMPAEQIVSNFLCIHNKLDTHDFRRGTMSDKEWRRMEQSLDELVGLPLYISDAATLRIMDLRAMARRLAHQHEIELIVVDYLQLMTPNTSRQNRATEVAEISQGLKALARELDVPVIAIAQLSRRVEQEQRRPRLSDLRESGAIEQDADVVLLLHRPYQPGDDEDGEVPGTQADLIIAKQRNGPIGLVRLVFQKRYLRFESRTTQPNFH